MPIRKFNLERDERSKREELKTYRELDLRRDLKSAAQRRRVEASGQRRVIGDGSGSQPYLIVETKRYRTVRLEVQKRLLLEARRIGLEIPVDTLLRQLKPRIEAMTYAQLAGEAGHDAMRHVTVAVLGRPLTPQERAQFAEAGGDGTHAANAGTQTALNHALGAIEQRQVHNPARYQTIWAGVVGLDAAQQSHLEQVDAATQTAWFRCTNSVLSYDLQRRKGLAAKLAKALGKPVRQLRARF
ncbi:MAG TPA: hypothetical protein VHY09_12565 [Candidatus Methylacidiphilales bacterium]|jgi:hypothetical protein|nr:hypothetical protein [Candidatus Methylacidiphilales bacterium]